MGLRGAVANPAIDAGTLDGGSEIVVIYVDSEEAGAESFPTGNESQIF